MTAQERWRKGAPTSGNEFPMRNESPWDWQGGKYPDSMCGNSLMFPHQPVTSLQALMEAAPHDEPERSQEEDRALKELLADAIDRLPERLGWVFHAHHYRGLSFAQLGREIGMSKTHAHWLYQSAIIELRIDLEDPDE